MKQILIDDHTGVAVLRSQLNQVVVKTYSVVPDSLGDRLFRASLRWVHLQGTTGMTQEHLDCVSALLAEHGYWYC